MIVIYVLVALTVGVIAGYLARKGEVTTLKGLKEDLQRSSDRMAQQLDLVRNESVAKDKAIARCNAENNSLKELLQTERENCRRLIDEIKSNHSEALKSMRSNFSEIASEALRGNTEELKRYNAEQMAGLVAPVREEMAKVHAVLLNKE